MNPTATGPTGGDRAPQMPPSPFFRPSNLRVAKVTTPRGTQTAVLIKKGAGGEAGGIPFQDVEQKSSLLGELNLVARLVHIERPGHGEC